MSVRVIRKSLIVLIHQAARMRTGRDVTRASDGNIILISLPIYFSLEINSIQATIIRITKKHPLVFFNATANHCRECLLATRSDRVNDLKLTSKSYSYQI